MFRKFMDMKQRSLFTPMVQVFLVVVLLWMGAIATAQDTTSDATFAMPSDTVEFYIQALAQGDVVGILQASAVNEMSENFRFDLYVDRLRAVNLQAPAPSDHALYVEMNRAQFSSQLLFQTRNLTYGLLTTDPRLLDGQMVILDAEETTGYATTFTTELNPARLSQLQVMQTGTPYPDIVRSERYIENSNRAAVVYGADEQTEQVALLMFEGNTFYVGFTLLRYGDAWKISSIVSPLGATSSFGSPTAITEDEFADIISDS